MFAVATRSMLHGYRLFTLTHRHASLDQLEPYALAPEAIDERLRRLRERLGWEEVFYLATCNRVLYFFYSEDRASADPVAFRRALAIPADAPAVDPVYYEGEEAVLHLYDVAASIDSMVVGEREILRQLRHAYLQCHEGGHCGDHLRLVMQSAVATAKQVYHETRIGQKPVSVVSLAAQRIRQQRLAPKRARVLLIGAGQTNWLISKFIKSQGFEHVTVANRTLAKARTLARYHGGEAIALDALPTYTRGFDLLVVCTASTEPVVTPELFASLLGGESAREKVVVDLSIPHNVAAATVERYRFHYIQIDDLRRLAEGNMAFRAGEVAAARLLIAEQLVRFREGVQQRRVERALSDVPAEIRAVRRRATEEVFARELADLDADARDLVERMMKYMEKKCIGVPMRAARAAVRDAEARAGATDGLRPDGSGPEQGRQAREQAHEHGDRERPVPRVELDGVH